MTAPIESHDTGAVETVEARLVSALRELAKLSPLFGRSFADTALSDVPVSMPEPPKGESK